VQATDEGSHKEGAPTFKLKPNSNGSWTESVLHAFRYPARPRAGLIFDVAGNLYSTTAFAAGPADGGVVFKLSPRSGGSWAYNVLHVFQGNPAQNPLSGLILDKDGNLYGTTVYCGSGAACQGVVFEIIP
jgi:hypothetical protein